MAEQTGGPLSNTVTVQRRPLRMRYTLEIPAPDQVFDYVISYEPSRCGGSCSEVNVTKRWHRANAEPDSHMNEWDWKYIIMLLLYHGVEGIGVKDAEP